MVYISNGEQRLSGRGDARAVELQWLPWSGLKAAASIGGARGAGRSCSGPLRASPALQHVVPALLPQLHALLRARHVFLCALVPVCSV